MITLRLPIADINTVYTALEVSRDNAHTHEMDVAELEGLMEAIKEMADKDISTWDGYVTNEVNSVLETLLPEAATGNVGIKYERAMVQDGDSEEQTEDPNKAQAVSVNIVLTFTEPIDISNIDK